MVRKSATKKTHKTTETLLHSTVCNTINKRNTRLNHRRDTDAVQKSSQTRTSATKPLRTAELVSGKQTLDDGHPLYDISERTLQQESAIDGQQTSQTAASATTKPNSNEQHRHHAVLERRRAATAKRKKSLTDEQTAAILEKRRAAAARRKQRKTDEQRVLEKVAAAKQKKTLTDEQTAAILKKRRAAAAQRKHRKTNEQKAAILNRRRVVAEQ